MAPLAEYTCAPRRRRRRRLIGEAQARNESFELEYARLEGGFAPRAGWSAGSRWLPQRAAGHGDLSFAKEPAWRAYEAEAWRAASGAPVVYRWDADRAEASCHLGRGLFAAPCEPDEVAMLPPPPQWALTLVAFQPLPILVSEGWAEVHCYGP